MKILLFNAFICCINLAQAQQVFNDTLAKQLSEVHSTDQKYREQLPIVQKKYGVGSKEMDELQRDMKYQDSLNSIIVTEILDKYGWLSSKVVGDVGNSTLFLVIQHSGLETQEKYLPMLKDAVQSGNAKASSLALLEDRILLRKGKRQIYGSQVSWNMQTDKYFVLPLVDPRNVDKRRAQIGLPPIADYLRSFGLNWNVDDYIEELRIYELGIKKR